MSIAELLRRLALSVPAKLKIAAGVVMLLGLALNPAAANSKYASIVVDAKTGKVLESTNADSYRYPASLTKIMTLYMLFEQIDAGRVTMDTPMTVSSHAASQAPSKLGLKPGSTIRVRHAILALVTKSANDVAVVVAEHIGGSESTFATMMTKKARQLGMSRTTFRNASGLPNTEQRTTARDMARLGRAIQERFPSHYKLFATRSFKYAGHAYHNHNRLLGRVRGVDGIKTGYTRASGFNLVSSVRRGNRQIVAVVMGGKTGRSRDAQMAALIKSHINRASTGRRTVEPVVAKAMPRPEIRPEPQKSVEVVAAVPLPTMKPETTGSVPTPPNSIGAIAAAATRESTATSKPAHVAAYAPIPDRGWIIQIAAVPDERDAFHLLNEARTKAHDKLASAAPYTEKISKGSTTLYRARFAGFEDKKTAWAACDSLKQRDFSCLALPQ